VILQIFMLRKKPRNLPSLRRDVKRIMRKRTRRQGATARRAGWLGDPSLPFSVERAIAHSGQS
jgi:hypothetical protein